MLNSSLAAQYACSENQISKIFLIGQLAQVDRYYTRYSLLNHSYAVNHIGAGYGSFVM